MAYTNLINAISAVVKTNGNGEITGQNMQDVLKSIVNTIGANATFAGIATPATVPPSTATNANVFYIASQNGTYSNFGGIVVADEVVILSNVSGSWAKISTDITNNTLIYDILQRLPNRKFAPTGYINVSGQHVADQNWVNTDYIPINGNEIVIYLGSAVSAMLAVAFYDADKNFISGTNFDAPTSLKEVFGTITAPESARYVIATARTIARYIFVTDNTNGLSINNALKGQIGNINDPSGIYSLIGCGKCLYNANHNHVKISLLSKGTLFALRVVMYTFESNKTNEVLISGYITQTTLDKCIINFDDDDIIAVYKDTDGKAFDIEFKSSKHKLVAIDAMSANTTYAVTSVEVTFHNTQPESVSPSWERVENCNSIIGARNIYAKYCTNVGYIHDDGINITKNDSNWRYSDYISFTEGEMMRISAVSHPAVSNVTFYDNEKNVIETHTRTTSTASNVNWNETFVAPSATKYVRLCGSNGWAIAQGFFMNVNIPDLVMQPTADVKKATLDCITPNALYTVCNDVVASRKGRNRNFTSAFYLDHCINGLTEEKDWKFKNFGDKVTFTSNIEVTNSNEFDPAVRYNVGNNIAQANFNYSIIGTDIEPKNFVVNIRSTKNSITATAHPKVLIIGDSITYGEQATTSADNYTQNHCYHLYCKELFMKDNIDNNNSGYDITFLGIYQKSKTFDYNGTQHTATTHHEGIRGISITQHLNGSVPQFWDGEKWSLQAWLDKYRTLDDDGNRLSLGSGTGSLITASNINNIDVCTPTHVVIALGMNAGGTLAQWQTMIDTIKDEFPNVVIGVAILDVAGTYFPSRNPQYDEYTHSLLRDVSRHGAQYDLQKMLQAVYANTEGQNIYMLPMYYVTPPAASVSNREAQLPENELTNSPFYSGYGWYYKVHSNAIGHANWGYQLYSWLKYTIAKSL